MATTTNLSSLKINYLTQEQYDTALAGGNINENEIYMTPSSGSGDIDVNDMTEQEVDEFVENLNTHGKSSEYRKLLWTNTQGAQSTYSITANFSEYDELEIIFDRNNSLISTRIAANVSSATLRVLYGDYIVERGLTITDNTLVFGNGAAYTSYNTATPTVNYSYAVPSKIYGIKYERVNPPQVEIADCIIEVVTDGTWIYRKWNSGLAECWSTQSWASKAITTAYGHGYYAPADTINLPSGLFTTVSNVQATSRDTAGYGTWFNVTSVSTSSIVGYMYSVSSITTSCSVSLYVVGKWK